MSTTCLYLTHLTLKGLRVPDAEVRFQRGLNVIVGVSNTGKTFIAQCVDFMFGASSTPKEIPEAASYDTVRLGLCSGGADDELVLERSLRGGDFILRASGTEERKLGAKHQADNEETVSQFLLNLSGLAGRKVRTHQYGKTRPLSFRDIARLVLVDETSVIAERSPIFSGQHNSRTAESSVFRFFLTGIDDSSVIAKEDPRVAKGRREGGSEVVETLLEKARAQVTGLDVDGGETELRAQLTRLDASLEEASLVLAAEQESAAALESARREAWERLRKADSRLSVLAELQKRFELLRKQYASDLHRLESISEAGFRLGQMKEERCPVCGALAEHHDLQHRSSYASPEAIAISCNAEVKKIRTLLEDLQGTLSANLNEVEHLERERYAKRGALEMASTQLVESLQPRVQAALQKFRDSQAQRDKVRREVELLERVGELERLLGEIAEAPKRERADGPPTAVGADEAEDFCREVEGLLRSWHFPDLGRVTFSEEDQDVVISGQRRASHGKGVRAIIHAAFNLALLKYCQGNSKPHPGLVLIDSPLIVYRQPDAGEDNFTHDVKDWFYRVLAKEFKAAQVIIFENDGPSPDLSSSVNIIQFTGTSHGRRGFIP